MWKGVITNGGSAVLARWTEGKKLSVTGAKAGTGRVSELAMLAQTALVNEKQAASVLGSGETEQGQKLKIQITPPAQGYTLHQIGVFGALEGETAVLLALFQTDTDAGVEIPSISSVPDFVYTFYALIAVGNTGELEVNIDTSALASAEDAAELADKSAAAAVAAHNGEAGAHSAKFAAKQDKITANGVLVGDGKGGISAKAVDSAPTAGSGSLVTSGGVKSALDGKADLEGGKVKTAQIPELSYVKVSQLGAAGGAAQLGSDGKVPTNQLPELGADAEAIEAAVAAHNGEAGAHSAKFAAKQDKITANGVLTGDGKGGISAKAVDSAPMAGSGNLVTSGGVKSALDGITPTGLNVYTKEETDMTVQQAINAALAAEMQEKSVTPGAATQEVTPDSGYAGLSKVTVAGDGDLAPGNIKKGVNLFGVTGTLEEGTETQLQQKTVTPDGSEITVSPDEGYDGLSAVTVEGDDNLAAENIRNGVTIYGVEGSYSGSGGGGSSAKLGTLTVTENGTYTPTGSLDGWDEVVVNVAAEADAPQTPETFEAYIEEAAEVYTGSYNAVAYLEDEDRSYHGVLFMMSDFSVETLNEETAEMTYYGAVYVGKMTSESEWEEHDYRESTSKGENFAVNIRYSTVDIVFGATVLFDAGVQVDRFAADITVNEDGSPNIAVREAHAQKNTITRTVILGG